MNDYISREAALQALCEAVHAEDEYIPCRNQILSCQWKGTRTQEYAEKILAIPPADVRLVRWIPVTERLPDAELGSVSERVLVTDGEDVAIVEWFNFEECGKFWGYTGLGKDVTHWMPLPEPPKEADE